MLVYRCVITALLILSHLLCNFVSNSNIYNVMLKLYAYEIRAPIYLNFCFLLTAKWEDKVSPEFPQKDFQ